MSDPASKVLLTIADEDVSPRFDHTTEVLIVILDRSGAVRSERTVVLPQASAEDLCQLIVTEGVDTVVCGGIEEEFHQYLGWKRVRVLDSVMGSWPAALDRLRDGTLASGRNLYPRPEEDGADD
jgi:predicted Fe-Mo cluster-binding NifX family protein